MWMWMWIWMCGRVETIIAERLGMGVDDYPRKELGFWRYLIPGLIPVEA